MAVLMGVDEAGYGPLLGPLVVSAAVVQLPDELLTQSLWDILRQSVCLTAQGAAGRIIINDSKKLKQAHGCCDRLQRGVLASLKLSIGNLPRNLFELLNALNVPRLDDLQDYPWYRSQFIDWPLHYDSQDIITAAAAFENDMKQHNMTMLGLWPRIFWVGRFNNLVEKLDNKASVSFLAVSELINLAYKCYGEKNLQIVIDRQGGRSHYRESLQRSFPHASMKILKETPSLSSYSLSESKRAMKIHFIEKGETRQLPIALASMTSKYLRELFIGMLNAYFERLCPGLKPTAGYYQDGQRFLDDLQKHGLTEAQLCRALLVRTR